jgi:hypothetical protein
MGRLRKKPQGKVGSGSRFESCVHSVAARGGASNPKAVCAAAGRHKYGKERYQKMAAAGRHHHH